jgi:hypothetical protein
MMKNKTALSKLRTYAERAHGRGLITDMSKQRALELISEAEAEHKKALEAFDLRRAVIEYFSAKDDKWSTSLERVKRYSDAEELLRGMVK